MALAFDRRDAAARHDGVALTIVSAFSGQRRTGTAVRRPPRRQVGRPARQLPAPPGNELDLGPPSAYGWLATNAPRFGFIKRYSCEPCHSGYGRVRSPPGLRLGRPGTV